MLKNLIGAAVLAVLAAAVWQSLPDLKRYLRISRM
ncbi:MULTISPECIES: DUF6893 family small protein [unclassified Kitasatospora]